MKSKNAQLLEVVKEIEEKQKAQQSTDGLHDKAKLILREINPNL